MIAVIADDLTGAAELGAIGLRHRLAAEVLHYDAMGKLCDSKARLVCVNTDSRNCAPRLAAQRAAAVARALWKRGVTRIYKKVDSVLRGPVVAELDAIRRALGRDRVLLVPANPSAGRVVIRGQYLLNGVPLDQTDFRFDPRHPRRSASVIELLRSRGPGRVEVRPRRAGVSGLSPGKVTVGEAVRLADLRWWARRLDARTLPAGAAEFFNAWLKSLGLRRVPGGENPLPHGRELFVCGSASEATRRFVEASRRAEVAVFCPARAAGRRAEGRQVSERLRCIQRALDRRGRVVLAWPPVAIRDRDTVRRMFRQMVNLAAALVLGQGVERVFVEGGETAAALALQLGWKRLRVVGELLPGVVALSPVEINWPGVLVVKPGSYQWPDSLRLHPMPQRG